MEKQNGSSEKNPYFSVVLPVYNVEPYLKACIESVLNQDFEDYEIILVDDGATDGCPAICDDYAANYENIRVVHKENGGLSSARNVGLDIAKGKYIWWVDSDDWIEHGALSKLWESSRENEPDILKFRYYKSTKLDSAKYEKIKYGLYSKGKGLDAIVDEAFLCAGAFCLSACTNIYRIDFIKRNNLHFESERIVGSEDYLFNLQALMAVEKIAIEEKTLYFYREREGSLTHTYKRDLAERYTKLYERLLDHCVLMESKERYEKKINTFYVWHLIRGTCISSEYNLAHEANCEIHRENVRKILNLKTVQSALKNLNKEKLNWKQRIQLIAMHLKCEPFFYWLYVRKKRRK